MTANTHTQEEYVFVYGTLRQQGSNAWRMQGASFLSSATAHGHLYRVDWYPAAIFDDAAEPIIRGELYRISTAHLHDLDAFEGEEYHRIKISLCINNQQAIAWAWEYNDPVENLGLIPSGDWLLVQ